MSSKQPARVPRIKTNLQPNQQIAVPNGLLFAYFGEEIMAWVRKRSEQSTCKPNK